MVELDVNTFAVQLAESVRESLKDEFKEINLRLNKVENRLDGIDGQLDKIESLLDGVEDRLDKFEVRLDVMEGRLDFLQQAVVELKDDMKEQSEVTNYLIQDVYLLKNRKKLMG